MNAKAQAHTHWEQIQWFNSSGMIETLDKLFRPRMSKPQCSHIIIERKQGLWIGFKTSLVWVLKTTKKKDPTRQLTTMLTRMKIYGIFSLWPPFLTNWICASWPIFALFLLFWLLMPFYVHSKQTNKKNTKFYVRNSEESARKKRQFKISIYFFFFFFFFIFILWHSLYNFRCSVKIICRMARQQKQDVCMQSLKIIYA